MKKLLLFWTIFITLVTFNESKLHVNAEPLRKIASWYSQVCSKENPRKVFIQDEEDEDEIFSSTIVPKTVKNVYAHDSLEDNTIKRFEKFKKKFAKNNSKVRQKQNLGDKMKITKKMFDRNSIMRNDNFVFDYDNKNILNKNFNENEERIATNSLDDIHDDLDNQNDQNLDHNFLFNPEFGFRRKHPNFNISENPKFLIKNLNDNKPSSSIKNNDDDLNLELNRINELHLRYDDNQTRLSVKKKLKVSSKKTQLDENSTENLSKYHKRNLKYMTELFSDSKEQNKNIPTNKFIGSKKAQKIDLKTDTSIKQNNSYEKGDHFIRKKRNEQKLFDFNNILKNLTRSIINKAQKVHLADKNKCTDSNSLLSVNENNYLVIENITDELTNLIKTFDFVNSGKGKGTESTNSYVKPLSIQKVNEKSYKTINLTPEKNLINQTEQQKLKDNLIDNDSVADIRTFLRGKANDKYYQPAVILKRNHMFKAKGNYNLPRRNIISPRVYNDNKLDCSRGNLTQNHEIKYNRNKNTKKWKKLWYQSSTENNKESYNYNLPHFYDIVRKQNHFAKEFNVTNMFAHSNYQTNSYNLYTGENNILNEQNQQDKPKINTEPIELSTDSIFTDSVDNNLNVFEEISKKMNEGNSIANEKNDNIKNSNEAVTADVENCDKYKDDLLRVLSSLIVCEMKARNRGAIEVNKSENNKSETTTYSVQENKSTPNKIFNPLHKKLAFLVNDQPKVSLYREHVRRIPPNISNLNDDNEQVHLTSTVTNTPNKKINKNYKDKKIDKKSQLLKNIPKYRDHANKVKPRVNGSKYDFGFTDIVNPFENTKRLNIGIGVDKKKCKQPKSGYKTNKGSSQSQKQSKSIEPPKNISLNYNNEYTSTFTTAKITKANNGNTVLITEEEPHLVNQENNLTTEISIKAATRLRIFGIIYEIDNNASRYQNCEVAYNSMQESKNEVNSLRALTYSESILTTPTTMPLKQINFQTKNPKIMITTNFESPLTSNELTSDDFVNIDVNALKKLLAVITQRANIPDYTNEKETTTMEPWFSDKKIFMTESNN